MLKHLDLCSGIGGFAVGFSMAELSEPIAFCDTDKFCQKVLAKNFPNIPIYDDVKEIADDPTRFISERPDILTAGYPCQPFSTSGKRGGSQDPRHIFPYLHKLIEQIRPTYCVFENVYGHLSLGLDEVLFAMESLNYHTRTFVLPSSAIGARHKRERLWIICRNLGDPHDYGFPTTEKCRGNEENARGTQKRSQETEQSEEQVDPKTMEMYPTPTTKGFGHASEGQTMMFRRKVEKGELTEAEAQAMMNGVTLRPPRMEEWNYPTPTSSLKKHSYNGNKDFWENRVEKGRQMDLGMKMYQTEGDGRLNCDWTEWLMGYPIGWTNLEESQE